MFSSLLTFSFQLFNSARTQLGVSAKQPKTPD